MMCEVTIPFHSLAVLLPDHEDIIFKTDRKWSQQSPPKLRASLKCDSMPKMIYTMPATACEVRFKQANNLLYHINCYTTWSVQDKCEGVALVTLPLELGDSSPESFALSDEHKAMIKQLSNDCDIEFILTRGDCYKTAKAGAHIYAHIIGEDKNVSDAKSFVAVLLDKITAAPERELFLDVMELDSVSLVPLVIGHNANNLPLLKNTLLTKVYPPSLNSDARQLLFTSTSAPMLAQTKDIIGQHISALTKTSLYYGRLPNVPLLKLIYIEKFKTNSIMTLMIRFQTYIKLNMDSMFVEFQAVTPTILQTVMKVFTVQILQPIMELCITYKQGTSINKKDSLKLFDNFTVCSILKKDPIPRITLVSEYTILNSILPKILNFESNQLRQMKLICQVHSEFHDFVCGKKSGKLTRIMDRFEKCLIQLTNDDINGVANPIMMNLCLISDSREQFPQCFKYMVDELPAEKLFYLPELFHRPIIGTGGSIIQTIMRKHNVFIQFSNSFLLPQGKLALTRYDNVLIRCPNKNKESIDPARIELLTLMDNFNMVQYEETLNLTPCMFNDIVLFKDLNCIPQLEKKYNVFVKFPNYVSKESKLSIHGLDQVVCKNAANELKNLLWSKEVKIVLPSKFEDFAAENKLAITNEIIMPFQRIWKSIIIQGKNTLSMTYNQEEDLVHQLDVLSEYLLSRDIELVETVKV
ncbi:uncharacterized protein KNAG_0E01010 [Huiozyma naganishii CBS 8797]|uniref:K Homology domain-containing protein n=1 Tax=Huiozyma naganishii (strain ATCC MYA-139 / BCRC 22969 / CBS 8797 / KCTC 17520 / NBRC 10181 / NCYC 3082 / Yp74L-3) TaxID=1071383 RepID=J7S6G3_HUIN7|nr:hypothetical protein KNAG_0E01010 [Kazachstania naganishii CBS 8797]CCK70369.1 hypothetical protein KNAG_0E01010 [Kazachstania naganishii CBS 8797]